MVIPFDILEKKDVLFNIMMTYSVYHPHPGYSQGMSDMLTPIVYVFNDESMSYFAYCSLMNGYMNCLFDRDQMEINDRLQLFDLIFESIDNDLWKKIYSNEENSLFVYRWLLLDCKREFHSFDHVLRALELVWICSMSSSCQSSINDRGLFSIFLSISILQEDREKIFACSTEEDFYQYFYSSSSSARSSRSIRRIFQRAQIYYFNYSSSTR